MRNTIRIYCDCDCEIRQWLVNSFISALGHVLCAQAQVCFTLLVCWSQFCSTFLSTLSGVIAELSWVIHESVVVLSCLRIQSALCWVSIVCWEKMCLWGLVGQNSWKHPMAKCFLLDPRMHRFWLNGSALHQGNTASLRTRPSGWVDWPPGYTIYLYHTARVNASVFSCMSVDCLLLVYTHSVNWPNPLLI